MTPTKQYRESVIHLVSGIHEHGHADLNIHYWLGAVPTVHGFVHVYGQDDYAAWGFIHDGRQFDLTIRRGFTERGLVTIARRFAADVVEGPS